MKLKKYSFVLLLSCVLFGIGVEVSAMNTGFLTEKLPENDVQMLLENVNIQMFTKEPEKNTIQCFDVDENGTIAVGCNNFNKKTVCLYSAEGCFQYGYTFMTDGSFGVELDNEILIIYFVRGDIAVAIGPNGQIESVRKIQTTTENNSYWNNSVYLKSRKSGNNEYTLKNDMGVFNIFASSYSKLIVTNVDGEEKILYDAGSVGFFRILVIFIAAVIFIAIVILEIRKAIIKYNEETNQGRQSGDDSVIEP